MSSAALNAASRSAVPVSSWGSRLGIRPSLLSGAHPRMLAGSGDARGRYLFAADVLLHECIHQWQMEITGQTEGSYHGHGPSFARKANEIGAALGLHRPGPRRPRLPVLGETGWLQIPRSRGYRLAAPKAVRSHQDEGAISVPQCRWRLGHCGTSEISRATRGTGRAWYWRKP